MSATVLEYGGDEDLAIAALLHDSVEDKGARRGWRTLETGSATGRPAWWRDARTALLKTAKGEQKAEWQTRREAYLAYLDTADDDVLRVSLADKIHNARAILRDLQRREVGESIWSRSSQPSEKTLWYYRNLADKFRDRWRG